MLTSSLSTSANVSASWNLLLLTLLTKYVPVDNPVADPAETKSFARADLIGDVVVSDVQKSVTKETIDKFVKDIDVGIGLTDIVTSTGGTFHRINTNIDHGFNRITAVSIASSGTGYGTGVDADYYNAKLVGIGTSTTGINATAKVTVDATGGITAVKIMDGGSAYGIGTVSYTHLTLPTIYSV